jgi:hypothetical protein
MKGKAQIQDTEISEQNERQGAFPRHLSHEEGTLSFFSFHSRLHHSALHSSG